MNDVLKIEIRQATPVEHVICAYLYEQAWNYALPSVQRSIPVVDFEREVEGELVLLALQDSEVLGYISVWEPDWFVHHLYVDPRAHGVGVGTALMSHVLRLASPAQVSLKCQFDNLGAIAFYRAMGFEETNDLGSDEYGDWVRFIKAGPNA